MQIWHVAVNPVDGGEKLEALARSEKEAREKVAALGGEKANGTARLLELKTDKDGIISIFDRDLDAAEVHKTFAVIDGKFKSKD
jgi:hypothetical protein